jgi:uncharacterized protein YwlG (UPF0340 family)
MGDAAALIGSDRGKYTSSKVAERIVNSLEDDQSSQVGTTQVIRCCFNLGWRVAPESRAIGACEVVIRTP